MGIQNYGYNSDMRNNDRISHNQYALLIGDRGRIVLPAKARHRMGLGEGDQLILTVEEEGTARLVSARTAARQAKGILKDLLPGSDLETSLADELISDRRIEGADESE